MFPLHILFFTYVILIASTCTALREKCMPLLYQLHQLLLRSRNLIACLHKNLAEMSLQHRKAITKMSSTVFSRSSIVPIWLPPIFIFFEPFKIHDKI